MPGLVTEAETAEALLEKLSRMVPEMLRLNGVDVSKDDGDLPFHLMDERSGHIRA